MKLHILQSGSIGNGYVFEANNGEVLLLECGIRFIEVQKVLNFDISGIVGCFFSHGHLDHSKYASEYLSYTSVFCSKETAENTKLKGSKKLTICDELKTITLGGFKVKPFPVQHDIHTLGFIVNHPEIGQLIFATDTYFLKYKFPGTTTWLIEANYDEHILDANIKAGKLNSKMKRRVFQSHMEISQTIDTLKANDLSSTRNIILIHLSDGNSNEKEFIERTIKATGIPNVYAAKKGLTINIDKNLF